MLLPERTYALEAFLAVMMITCGATLIYPGETFLLPHYGFIRDMVGEGWAGGALALTGLVRIRAIIANGGYRYSPVWRIGCCCLGGGFWLALATAVFLGHVVHSDPQPELGVPLLLPITLTAFIFEILSVIRGSEDAAAKDSFGIRESRSKTGARHGRVP